MGFKQFFGGKQKGVQCSKNPDGSDTCVRYELDNNGNKIATGSELTLSVDPSTCQAVMGGDVNSLNDDEVDDFDRMAKAKERACKRGIG
jgi:hypothetical protein